MHDELAAYHKSRRVFYPVLSYIADVVSYIPVPNAWSENIVIAEKRLKTRLRAALKKWYFANDNANFLKKIMIHLSHLKN